MDGQSVYKRWKDLTMNPGHTRKMSADKARSLYPTDTDRHVVIGGELLLVTVIAHTDGAVIVGKHPDLFKIPYSELRWTLDR